MSGAKDPREGSHLNVHSPLDALDRAQQLPDAEEMVIEGVTDDEWAAFEQALTDR